MSHPKAMNLRFPDPAQRAAIEAAAKQEGVSLQEYILSAAYARATAVEERFLEAFRASMARSGDAFAEGGGAADPGAEQRAAELQARRDLEEQQERGHAA
ncbi:type II toxin -antitoxin system TacA 1-like antitoxin [Streptomyces diastatochromogenes]|uniref:type II toxin -antitoxin system TacA 1-like antitoxin n=1 Tax=Streptomyces diastatochromogenes TaxID=42236 RepID=UPI0036787C94